MAFPSTPIIDAFTRADENPLAAPWLGQLISTEDQLQLVSNEAAVITAGTFGGSYTTLCGPDCEAYATFTTVDAGNRCEVYARVFIDGSGTDAYCVSQVGGTWSLRSVTNSTSAAIGATFVQAVASGDSMGIKVSGNTIEAWYKAAAGAWTLLATRTDSTWTNAGYLGLRFFDLTYRADNFGGGTTVATGDTLSVHHGMGMGLW